MEYMIRKQHLESGGDLSLLGDLKRSAEDDVSSEHPVKKPRLSGSTAVPESVESSAKASSSWMDATDESQLRQIQKFRYVMPDTTKAKPEPGYRLLLATYADAAAAAEDDPEKAVAIEAACESGGNFVGDYYYQYEAKSSVLKISESTTCADDSRTLRMSMGLQSFLQSTPLPSWFPLSNLQVGQQKVLSLLNMKKDNSGNIIYDETANSFVDNFNASDADRILMEPRSRYRVCVVGGGIAGLSCCMELFRICEREKIDVEVVMVEGRSRLGGRLWTDRDTFKGKNGTEPFPVDLGASWIHGISMNPLASLAQDAGVEFVTTSEDVKMFESNMVEVDSAKDKNAGELFDKLLDLAAHDCWSTEDTSQKGRNNQSVIRWYASVLGNKTGDGGIRPTVATVPPPHRQSNDVSVDVAVGKAIVKHKLSEFALLSPEERNMLTWNTKNVEYALGANIKDVSMKFWDIDERHAFEGDHVLLRQGYSTVVDHLHASLKQRGDRFISHLNFPVAKIEYNRKTTTQAYVDLQPRHRKCIELSDSCAVTSQDGERSIACDFVVSAVPLGVLKMAILEGYDDSAISFRPSLPFLKRDAIRAVGFGLLNKAYIQFPSAFWRKEGLLEPHQTQFGNASGVNPHHYMFLDIGRTLESSAENPPPILMSLISGREAAACEQLSHEKVIEEILETLRALFSPVGVPNPIAFKVTQWGADPFSRGSYTFLTPGTSDEDFEALQSPVNGNGDSLLLEGPETMRLYFAGEHTTALYPSMAHGAQLSGVRAAKEIVDSMVLSVKTDDHDRVLPMSMFRHLNSKHDLRCCLCHRAGTTIREGKLLAFKKGSRQIVCHNNCAENSSEVEVVEGKWKGVFAAVTRSASLSCFLCRAVGATISCAHEDCERSYHFTCGEDTGWRFHADSEEFYCDLHRSADKNDSRRVSLAYLKSKEHTPKLMCELCGVVGADNNSGELLVFQRFCAGKEQLATVHENCIRHTTIIDIGENDASRLQFDFLNVFSAIEQARPCSLCGRNGATISCSTGSCGRCYHYMCAEKSAWKFNKQGSRFSCLEHRALDVHSVTRETATMSDTKMPESREYGPREVILIDDDDGSELLQYDEDDSNGLEVSTLPADIPLASLSSISKLEGNRRGVVRLGRLCRESIRHPWNVNLYATCAEGSVARVLKVATSIPDPFDQLEDGDVVQAINGQQVGSPELDSLQKVFTFLSQEVEAMVEVRRFHRAPGQWF